MSTTKAPDVLNFRGSITRPLAWLSTLRSEGHPSPRKTRFWLLARLCQAGLNTRRVPTKGFRVRGSSSLPKLSWRKVIRQYRRTLGHLGKDLATYGDILQYRRSLGSLGKDLCSP